jgi:hypothetical protein
MDPNALESICDSLDCLKHHTWTEASLLSRWLLDQWTRMNHPEPQYIPNEYLALSKSELTTPEINQFRRMFGLCSAEQGGCPLVPKMALVHVGGNHFCCMVVHPEEREVHVLGRLISNSGRITNSQNWDAWGGDRVWEIIASLHGWEVTPMTVREVHWAQNGYDCGPIACQIMEHIWREGFLLDEEGMWIMPALLCCHSLRIRLAVESRESILQSIADYQWFEEHRPEYLAEHTMMDSDKIKELKERLMNDCLRGVFSSIKGAMSGCLACLKTRVREGARTESEENKRIRKKFAQYPCLKGVKRALMTAMELPSPTEESDHSTSTNSPKPQGEEVLADDEESQEDGDLSKEKNSPLKDRSQATLGRFPRPIPPVVLPHRETLRGRLVAFDGSYDDYEDGPTLDALKSTMDDFDAGQNNLLYVAGRITDYHWETFKDYGWRIMPSFFQTFDLHPPILVDQHAMPSVQLPHGDEEDSDWDDILSVGPRRMIQMANRTNNDIDVFVKGISSTGDYLRVDMTKDAIPLGEDQIMMSCDIDSLVWTTRNPQFKQAAEVFVTPVIRHCAPISKHNHIYINVLVPPSEEDRAMGQRSEWWEKRFRLSQLPHIALGKIGSGSGVTNILLFLPRMAHQSRRNGYWQNLVPSNIQNHLWDSVINPAINRVMSDLDQPYVGLNRDHIEFKRGRSQGDRSTSSYPFKEEQFKALVKEMDRIVSYLIRHLMKRSKLMAGID